MYHKVLSDGHLWTGPTVLHLKKIYEVASVLGNYRLTCFSFSSTSKMELPQLRMPLVVEEHSRKKNLGEKEYLESNESNILLQVRSGCSGSFSASLQPSFFFFFFNAPENEDFTASLNILFLYLIVFIVRTFSYVQPDFLLL